VMLAARVTAAETSLASAVDWAYCEGFIGGVLWRLPRSCLDHRQDDR
jgi:hypothetical protein